MPEPPAESLAWVRGAAKVKKLALPVSFVVGITAISGAFVAGNDAVSSLKLNLSFLVTERSLDYLCPSACDL